MTADNLVQLLELHPHPEGGFYKEIYRSSEYVSESCLPKRFEGDRSICTSIYYLLEKGDFSAFHRIKSDEIWHYYHGGSVLIHMLHPNSLYECRTVGSNIADNAVFQLVIPAGTWFAAEPAVGTDFILSGCTVAPGFDFSDFELADKEHLTAQFPQHQHLINRLCR
jgi:predicted cupin superfamily sugar epimerase